MTSSAHQLSVSSSGSSGSPSRSRAPIAASASVGIEVQQGAGVDAGPGDLVGEQLDPHGRWQLAVAAQRDALDAQHDGAATRRRERDIEPERVGGDQPVPVPDGAAGFFFSFVLNGLYGFLAWVGSSPVISTPPVTSPARSYCQLLSCFS